MATPSQPQWGKTAEFDTDAVGGSFLYERMPLMIIGRTAAAIIKVKMAKADHVTKLTAVCVARHQGEVCGKPATRSYRLPDRDSGEQVQVGSAGMYEARCRVCWARGRG